MLNINSNYGAFLQQKLHKSNNNSLNTAFERLSSGSRINFAKDDAGIQGIANAFICRNQRFEMASRNAADAQAIIRYSRWRIMKYTICC